MSFPKSTLSAHATVRLSERFRISSADFLKLLNAGQGKKIGISSSTRLAHRLLWSHVDEQLLVAIQDVVNGTILTVLTIEMYCRDYNSNITDGRIIKVINMMVHSNLAPASLWRPGAPDECVTVYATIQDSLKPVALGRWRGVVESVNLHDLGKIPEFWSWIVNKILAKGYMTEHLASVQARFSGGDLQDIPYAC